MHQEQVLDLGFLGQQDITRASDIRFDSESQTWGIWVAKGDTFVPPPCGYAQGFMTYEGARKVEVEWFQKARLEGVAPDSETGILVLRAIMLAGLLSSLPA